MEVIIVAEMVIRLSRMVLHGSQGISLFDKRNYRAHIPDNQSAMMNERWRLLGARFRKSMEKVVSEYAKTE